MELIRKIADDGEIEYEECFSLSVVKPDNNNQTATDVDEYFPTIPPIIFSSDSIFTKNNRYQILPFAQTGQLPGHYVKIYKDGTKHKVSANATTSDCKGVFNFYTYHDINEDRDYQIIESDLYPKQVIAMVYDKVAGVYKVVVKTCSKPPSQYHSIKEVLASDPEILLIRSRKSIYSMYRFYTTGSSTYYLGFGSNGKPLAPSTVRPRQDQAKFRIFPKQNACS